MNQNIVRTDNFQGQFMELFLAHLVMKGKIVLDTLALGQDLKEIMPRIKEDEIEQLIGAVRDKRMLGIEEEELARHSVILINLPEAWDINKKHPESSRDFMNVLTDDYLHLVEQQQVGLPLQKTVKKAS